MEARMRKALESVLFFDETTPVKELIGRCANEPLHLLGEASTLLAGPGSIFSLWHQAQSYSLLAADLHSFARDAGLPRSGLVLRLPSSIDGVPLTRISSEAFRSWLSYGISIRILILPEGMEETSDEALSPLCFEHCHLPSTLERFGARNVRWNKLTCYPRRVRYSVSEENTSFSAKDGSLLSADGRTLVAQSYPFSDTVSIPDGTVAIRPDAFMHTPRPPKTILCPDSLETVDDLVDEFTVWTCRQNGNLTRSIRARGGYTVSQEGKEEDGIVYDKAGDTASLVLCRPDRDKTTILDTIDGAALRTIGARSLKGAIETLALPAHVRTVEDGNAPRPCRKLVLNEGLETIGDRCFSELAAESPARIPRSVRAIGKGSFSGAMLGFDALDAIVAIPGGSHALFKPCRYLENEKGELVCAGPCNNDKEAKGPKGPASTESETPGRNASIVPFDMNAYDTMLLSGRYVKNKNKALLFRFESGIALPEASAREFARLLRSDSESVLELVATASDAPRTVRRLAQAGFYDNDLAEKQCEILRRARKTKALHVLMEWITQQSPCKPEKPSARFAF